MVKKETKKRTDEEILDHLTNTLKKWKHTIVHINGEAYIAHHVDKKQLKMYNPKHIHEVKVKRSKK